MGLFTTYGIRKGEVVWAERADANSQTTAVKRSRACNQQRFRALKPNRARARLLEVSDWGEFGGGGGYSDYSTTGGCEGQGL